MLVDASKSPFFAGMASVVPWLLSMCLIGVQQFASQPGINALSRDHEAAQRSISSGFRSVRTNFCYAIHEGKLGDRCWRGDYRWIGKHNARLMPSILNEWNELFELYMYELQILFKLEFLKPWHYALGTRYFISSASIVNFSIIRCQKGILFSDRYLSLYLSLQCHTNYVNTMIVNHFTKPCERFFRSPWGTTRPWYRATTSFQVT